MKKFLALMLAFCMMFALAACGNANIDDTTTADTTTAETTTEATTASGNTEVTNPDVDVRVIALKGPTGMGMSKLMDDDEKGTSKNNYEFTLAAAPEEVSAAVLKGEVDIAAVPVNLASVLYNKGADISFAAINTLGVLYMMENGNTITSIADLKGKTIYATGQGSTPEYILNYILTKNGIDPENDVTIEYIAEHAELATKLAENVAAIGLLPEPQVTVALTTAAQKGNADLRIALDMTEEWSKFDEGQLVQGCIIVSNKFRNEHPEQYAKFMEEYKASAAFVNENIDEASEIIANFGIVPKAPLAKKAIPNCNICCVDGEEGIAYMENILNVLYTANPKSVGGTLPADAFYGK